MTKKRKNQKKVHAMLNVESYNKKWQLKGLHGHTNQFKKREPLGLSPAKSCGLYLLWRSSHLFQSFQLAVDCRPLFLQFYLYLCRWNLKDHPPVIFFEWSNPTEAPHESILFSGACPILLQPNFRKELMTLCQFCESMNAINDKENINIRTQQSLARCSRNWLISPPFIKENFKIFFPSERSIVTQI